MLPIYPFLGTNGSSEGRNKPAEECRRNEQPTPASGRAHNETRS